MARIFTEHFETGHHRFNIMGGAVVSTVGLGTGDGSSFCLRHGNDPESKFFFVPSQTNIYMGFWFRFGSLTADLTTGGTDGSGTYSLIYFQDTGPVTPIPLIRIKLSGSGLLLGYVGTSLVATGITPLIEDQWYNFQIHYQLNSSGIYETRLNGVNEFSFAGNTTNSGSAITALVVPNSPNNQIHIDGIVVNDTSGGVENTWPGLIKAVSTLPDDDSATNDAWSRSTGTDGYVLVDERPPNTSDYVYSTVNGQQQGFTFGPHGLPAQATIVSVIHEHYMRKVTAGQVKLGMKSGATETLTGALDLDTSFKIMQNRQTTDPNTAAAWTLSNADNVESLEESVF